MYGTSCVPSPDLTHYSSQEFDIANSRTPPFAASPKAPLSESLRWQLQVLHRKPSDLASPDSFSDIKEYFTVPSTITQYELSVLPVAIGHNCNHESLHTSFGPHLLKPPYPQISVVEDASNSCSYPAVFFSSAAEL